MSKSTLQENQLLTLPSQSRALGNERRKSFQIASTFQRFHSKDGRDRTSSHIKIEEQEEEDDDGNQSIKMKLFSDNSSKGGNKRNKAESKSIHPQIEDHNQTSTLKRHNQQSNSAVMINPDTNYHNHTAHHTQTQNGFQVIRYKQIGRTLKLINQSSITKNLAKIKKERQDSIDQEKNFTQAAENAQKKYTSASKKINTQIREDRLKLIGEMNLILRQHSEESDESIVLTPKAVQKQKTQSQFHPSKSNPMNEGQFSTLQLTQQPSIQVYSDDDVDGTLISLNKKPDLQVSKTQGNLRKLSSITSEQPSMLQATNRRETDISKQSTLQQRKTLLSPKSSTSLNEAVTPFKPVDAKTKRQNTQLKSQISSTLLKEEKSRLQPLNSQQLQSPNILNQKLSPPAAPFLQKIKLANKPKQHFRNLRNLTPSQLQQSEVLRQLNQQKQLYISARNEIDFTFEHLYGKEQVYSQIKDFKGILTSKNETLKSRNKGSKPFNTIDQPLSFKNYSSSRLDNQEGSFINSSAGQKKIKQNEAVIHIRAAGSSFLQNFDYMRQLDLDQARYKRVLEGKSTEEELKELEEIGDMLLHEVRMEKQKKSIVFGAVHKLMALKKEERQQNLQEDLTQKAVELNIKKKQSVVHFGQDNNSLNGFSDEIKLHHYPSHAQIDHKRSESGLLSQSSGAFPSMAKSSSIFSLGSNHNQHSEQSSFFKIRNEFQNYQGMIKNIIKNSRKSNEQENKIMQGSILSGRESPNKSNKRMEDSQAPYQTSIFGKKGLKTSEILKQDHHLRVVPDTRMQSVAQRRLYLLTKTKKGELRFSSSVKSNPSGFSLDSQVSIPDLKPTLSQVNQSSKNPSANKKKSLVVASNEMSEQERAVAHLQRMSQKEPELRKQKSIYELKRAVKSIHLAMEDNEDEVLNEKYQESKMQIKRDLMMSHQQLKYPDGKKNKNEKSKKQDNK